jgi:hypothetical protein
MIPIRQYLLLNAVCALVLVAYLATAVPTTGAVAFYAMTHAVVAALLNTGLLEAIARRRISLLGSPVVSFLCIAQLYLTLSCVKYFTPNRAYAQYFDLTQGERFAGSMAAAGALALAQLLLWVLPRVSASRLQAWAEQERTLVPMLVSSTALAIGSKAALVALGYGSRYADVQYTENQLRSYWDLLLISGVGFFDQFALALAGMVLTYRLGRATWRGAHLVALAAIGSSMAWAVFVQARMPFLFLAVLLILSAQHWSFRRAVLALQTFLLVLPLAAVMSANAFTSMLGRQNIPGFGLIDTLAEIGYRADVTDLAVAITVRSRGEGIGLAPVVDGVSNAVPRIVWPSKDDYHTDAYYRRLASLGLPRVDYLETPFSNGAVAFGTMGWLFWPVAYLILVGLLAVALRGVARTSALRYYPLIGFGVLALRVEAEWEAVVLLFRDVIQFAILVFGLAWVLRVFPTRALGSLRRSGGITGTLGRVPARLEGDVTPT